MVINHRLKRDDSIHRSICQNLSLSRNSHGWPWARTLRFLRDRRDGGEHLPGWCWCCFFCVDWGTKKCLYRNTLFMFHFGKQYYVIMCVWLFCFFIKKYEIDIVLFFYLCLSLFAGMLTQMKVYVGNLEAKYVPPKPTPNAAFPHKK